MKEVNMRNLKDINVYIDGVYIGTINPSEHPELEKKQPEEKPEGGDA